MITEIPKASIDASTSHMISTRPETIPYPIPPHGALQHQQDHISYSQLSAYAACPLQWRFSRTRDPEFIPASRVFGAAFHAALERYYKARLHGKTTRLPDLMEGYDRTWMDYLHGFNSKPPVPIRHSAKSDPFMLRQTATRMLETFLAQPESINGDVVAVEEEFVIKIAPDLPLVKGRIDLAKTHTDSSGMRWLALIDFKTSAKRLTADDICRDQLDLYGMAA